MIFIPPKYLTRLSILWLAGVAVLSGGCSALHEDLEPCQKEMRLKFKYQYLKDTDAFKYEVQSIDVWAFDMDGVPVWHGAASGPELSEEDFSLPTPLDVGKYGFVAWCGLKDNPDFTLATYQPADRSDLQVTMVTEQEDGEMVSRSNLKGIYNGYVYHIEYKANPDRPTLLNVTIPLIKDTKSIRILLQNLDGREIDTADFTVSITDNNGAYAWNNDLLGYDNVVYRPWNIKYGVVTSPGEDQMPTRDITTVSSLMFEMATGRLMIESEATLTVRRNSDGHDIIRIPLIDYLLLVKGHYGNITDQQYLDLQDDYSIVFFIDGDSNWYIAGGIFINGWAVVPPQDSPL